MINIAIEKLKNNEIIVFPTDTIFGFLSIINKENIKKINDLKKRNPDQPLQILFSSVKEALSFSSDDYFVNSFLHDNYKKETSYIIHSDKKFAKKNLNSSFNQTFMFRVPEKENLLKIINEVGPVFASSVNINGEEPLNNFEEIKKTFDVFVFEENIKEKSPSKIISLINKEYKELR